MLALLACAPSDAGTILASTLEGSQKSDALAGCRFALDGRLYDIGVPARLLKVSDAHSEDVHKAAQAVRFALEARWRRLMPNLSSLEGISTAEETVII